MLTNNDFNITITYTTQALVVVKTIEGSFSDFISTISLVIHKREMIFSTNENFCSAVHLLKQAA